MRNYIAEEMRIDVDKAKKRLINRAKKRGLWENFGEKEDRKLQDKWNHQFWSEEYSIIADFSNWRGNFNDKDLEGVI